MNEQIAEIEQRMLPFLTNEQRAQLRAVLLHVLAPAPGTAEPEPDFASSWLAAKRVEGCSDRTLAYYETTIRAMLAAVGKPVRRIATDDLRASLDGYRDRHGAGKVTVDNVRRVLSSFFAWLESEDLIVKSPVRRIHRARTGQTVKETYSDEALERMRDAAGRGRDLAMIDLLVSTGMRVGELVRLDRGDIDFEARECVVRGKGDKERKVYFDARTKIHLQAYLEDRTDDNPALFATLQMPHARLRISGVEIRLRELGRSLGIPKTHPHKFRRTLATMAIDKGMPIEQVQHLLGHRNINTTMQYAMVNQTNVKASHRKFIS